MSKIIVKAKPNPFKSEIKEFELECGSLNELFYQLHTGLSVNHARFMVNGEIINDVEFTPNSGDETLILVVPGGGSTKDTGTTMKAAGWWLTAVGVIIAIAFSWTGIGAGIGIALIGAGLGMTAGGQALLSIKIPKNREEPKQDPSIKGSRNRENQGGYVPFLLGKHLFYPDVAAKPYTIIEGQNQYLVMLYCCGFNNMEIDKSTLKIGDTLLTEYAATKNIDRILDLSDDNVKLELIANGAESVLYPERVNEIQLNAIIKNKRDDDTSGAIIKTTVNNTEKINVDIFFYNGLGKYDDENNLKSTSVDIRAYYKLDGALDSAYQLLGNFAGSSNVISGSELKTKRFTVTKTGLAAGKYTVKIERVTGDSDAGKVIDQVYVGSIRCYIKGRVIDADTQKHLQIVALKVKATEQLNNVIDSLNMIATAILPDYTGSGSGQSAWIKRKTVNPASALLYAFQGNISQEPVSNDLIDWKSLEKWHAWCDQHKYECNLFVANDYALSDIANMITSTARADFVKIDGLISVIQDIAKPSHINLFTPRNTISYQQIIRFADIPDAVSCEFINAEADYQQDEIVVYNTPTGIYQKEAEKKQNINIPGITNAEQAFKIVRYKYACLTNRPRQHIIKLDIEYLACTKGDWIKYAGDTALTGLAFTRITSRLKVAENDAFIYGFETDSTFTLPQGENYAARIRKSDGKLLVYDIRPSGLEKNYFELLTPITQTDAPESGDLCVIGIKGKETLDLLVMDITPSDDFTATLKCVDYAPEIFGVDNPNYVIPLFESKITTGGYQDSGVVNPNDWKYFSTFNDSVIKPERPLGDGSDNGWHLLQTTESKWISYKTAKNLSSGVWANPIATSKGVEDNILGDYPEAAPPEQVKNINAVAWKDSVHISWNYQAKPGLTNTIRKYIIEISKDNGITWGRHNSSEASFIYQFNRKTDGYPEKTDLASWLVQVKAVNIYGKESFQWSETALIDASGYGTWLVQQPTISRRTSGRTITLDVTAKGVNNRELYGTLEYEFLTQRHDDSDNWYAPNVNSDPKSSETAYRGTLNPTSWYAQSWQQFIMAFPLEGQAAGLPIDTLYRFRIRARNEVTASDYIEITAPAAASSIMDITAGAIGRAQLARDSVDAEKLTILAKNKVNPYFVNTQTLPVDLTKLEGWNYPGAFQVSKDTTYGYKIALTITSTSHNKFFSNKFDVMPNEIFQFSFGIKTISALTGIFGIYVGLQAGQLFKIYQFDKTAKRWIFNQNNTNAYFIENFTSQNLTFVKSYIFGNSLTIDDIPAPSGGGDYNILALQLTGTDTESFIRLGFNMLEDERVFEFYLPQVLNVNAGKVVAKQIVTESLSAINSRLGEITGDDKTNYKLVMGQGFADPEGTFLLGSTGDDAYLRRWKSGGVWNLAIKLATFIVDSVSSKIKGLFQIYRKNEAETATSQVFEVQPGSAAGNESTTVRGAFKVKKSTVDNTQVLDVLPNGDILTRGDIHNYFGSDKSIYGYFLHNGSSWTRAVVIDNYPNRTGELQFMQLAAQNAAGDNPTGSWVNILKMGHGNADTYFNSTLAFDFFSDDIYYRRRGGGIAQPWKKVALENSTGDLQITRDIYAAGVYSRGGVRAEGDIFARTVYGNISALGGIDFSSGNVPGGYKLVTFQHFNGNITYIQKGTFVVKNQITVIMSGNEIVLTSGSLILSNGNNVYIPGYHSTTTVNLLRIV